ncbi:MAG: LuxR C-terminal-related transcriptional regulator [Dehalococcoidia bacterium]
MGQKGNILTNRERDVLVFVARGLTNRQIADQLYTSQGKVKSLLHQACVKLEAHNRIEAVFLAMRQKTLSVDEIFSQDELVELLSSLGPDSVEMIARLLRQKLAQERLPSGSDQIMAREKRPDKLLTPRERDVLALVARGLTNQEIADQLYTSTSTVRTFLYQASIKLEASNRAQAFISALRQGAVNVDEVFSLNELVELLASLGPEAMETVARLLRQRLENEAVPSGSG